MKVLLDTHAFLWWIADHPNLSARAREIIADGGCEVYFSTASAWEIAIKTRAGRLELPRNLEGFVTDQVALNAFRVLPVSLAHALHVHTLPDHHRDPFDRLIVAQAKSLHLPIVTSDEALGRYEVETLW